MKTYRSILLTALVSMSSFGFSQNNLSISDTNLFFSSDTIALNSSITISGVVTNTSPTNTYGGNLTIYIYNDSTGANGFGSLLQLDSIYFQNITISAASGMAFSDSIFIDPSFFRSGINTVVIWPRTDAISGFSTLDTARYNVFVFNELSTQQNIILDKIVLYPNPFSSKIWFTAQGENTIEQVRIFDVLGKELLFIKPTNKNWIDLSEYDTGIYLIQLQSKSGKLIIIKTIKE